MTYYEKALEKYKRHLDGQFETFKKALERFKQGRYCVVMPCSFCPVTLYIEDHKASLGQCNTKCNNIISMMDNAEVV